MPPPPLPLQAPLLFLPLVMRQVNDTDARCRTAVSAVLRMLFTHVDPRVLGVLFSYLTKWYQPSEQPALRRAAAQVLARRFCTPPGLCVSARVVSCGSVGIWWRVCSRKNTSLLVGTSCMFVLVS